MEMNFKRAFAVVMTSSFFVAAAGGGCPSAHYPLDSPEDGAAEDLVGGHPGVIFGAPGAVAGVCGAAMAFDGVDDYVEVPDNSVEDVGAGDFSLTAWVKTTSIEPYQIILDSRDESSLVGYELLLYSGQLMLQLNTADKGFYNFHTSASPRLTDGQWHFVAATVDRDNASGGTLYVDGVAIFTFDPTRREGDLSNNDPLWIGRLKDWDQFPFEGAIDDVRIYLEALPASEVTRVMSDCATQLPVR